MNNLNPFFIIGAASSGTTLLSITLDKHKDLLCGPEIAVFNKKLFYKNYTYIKNKLPLWLNKGTYTGGQVETEAIFNNLDYYAHTNESIIDLVNCNENHANFINAFFQKALCNNSKKIWGEKTGSNAYHINSLIKIFPNAKIIHIIRDPRDTILSIYNRTKKEKKNWSDFEIAYHAVSHYLFNTAAALQIENESKYLRIKYEDFILNKDDVTKSTLNHIGVNSSDLSFINNDNTSWLNSEKNNIHKTWKNNPLDNKFNSSSIEKYKHEEIPEILNTLMNNLILSSYSKKLLNSKIDSIPKIITHCSYNNLEKDINPLKLFHKKKIVKKELIRLKQNLQKYNYIQAPLFYWK